MKNIRSYMLVGSLLVVLLISALFFFSKDFNDAVENGSKIIQTIAIIVGWLRAYQKLRREKRAEDVIKTKQLLILFQSEFNAASALYQTEKNINEEAARLKFAMAISPVYNKVIMECELCIYLPKKIRKKILGTLRLALGENERPKWDDLTQKRQKFSTNSKELNQELVNLVSGI